MSCGIEGCEHPEYAEGVCLWHYPIWEHFGYEEGGYEIYEKYGQEDGRKVFKMYLVELHHQDIVNILTNYDWKLTQAVNESIESDTKRTDG